jgi:DnaJ-class molecular chaperone
MSYQKCPICNGSGMSSTLTSNYGKCHSCKGFGLINELTGLPPKETVTSNFTPSAAREALSNPNVVEVLNKYFRIK